MINTYSNVMLKRANNFDGVGESRWIVMLLKLKAMISFDLLVGRL